jgi:hypothetical protein
MKAIRFVLTLFLADVLMLAAIGLVVLLLWARGRLALPNCCSAVLQNQSGESKREVSAHRLGVGQRNSLGGGRRLSHIAPIIDPRNVLAVGSLVTLFCFASAGTAGRARVAASAKTI